MLGYDDEARWGTLFDRAAAAHDEAAAAIRRAGELQALITSVAGTSAVCCAWCGRIAPDRHRLPEPLAEALESRVSSWRLAPSARRGLTHGICPECYQRVASAAESERAATGTEPRREHA